MSCNSQERTELDFAVTPEKPSPQPSPSVLGEGEREEVSLTELSSNILQSVGVALNDASRRLQQTMAGESVFSNDGDRRVAMALVNRLHQLLPMLAKESEPVDESKFIPVCPICGKGPGQHWAHECPAMHPGEHNEFIYDYRSKCILKRMNMMDPFGMVTIERYLSPKPPRCGVCGAEPGTHWPAQCPQNPIRDKMVRDRVVSKSE